MNTSEKLLEAIEHHDAKMVSTLLKAGASLNDFGDHLDYSCPVRPLDMALSEMEFGGSLEIVEMLISAGVNVNDWDFNYSYKPLHVAVSIENFECVCNLLIHGADSNCISDEGETPLMYASESGRLDIVKVLLENGADSTINNFGGGPRRSALIHAVEGGHVEIVNILISHNANPNIFDDDGRLPCDFLQKDITSNSSSIKAILNL